MACLGSVLYDPTTAATASTASALAMTAFDTTNARITFTAPANGTVLVKLVVAHKGSSTGAMPLLGVLEGATVRGRQAPIRPVRGIGSNILAAHESVFLVTGLTPGNSYTWDAAYGVEFAVASTQFGWGGPNDAVNTNAYGALSFEVWETTNLLAGVNYDPATAVTSASAASLLAMTALDTTNLRLSFTVPGSGRVLVRERVVVTGGTSTLPAIHLGVLQGANVKGRQAAFNNWNNGGANVSTDFAIQHAEFVVAGLTPGASLTWDAAYGVETVAASFTLAYGGPDNTVASDAYGGFNFEVWSA